jgi:hypothetical protein
MAEQDLRNADLSRLSVEEMSPAQRAELKRRFKDFLRNVWTARPSAASRPAPPKKIKPWVPTKRV